MSLKIRLALEAFRIGKKHWPKALIALLLAVMAPFFLLMCVIAALFSWMDWGSANNSKGHEYQLLAVKYGLVWQELLAIDLAKHKMNQDELDPDSLVDYFVYYTEVEVVEENTAGGMVNTRKEKIQHIRSFEEVMTLLNFTDDQRDMALNSVALLYEESGITGGTGELNANVLAYEPLVREAAIKHKVEKYVDVILALIMQESGGKLLDVMQVSEALGKPPNTITDPAYSIDKGVEKFAERMKLAGFDIKFGLQTYNFGPYFVEYAKEHGGYSKKVTIAYSEMMAQKMKWNRFGDVDYPEHVLRYLRDSSEGDLGLDEDGMDDGTPGTYDGVQKFDYYKILAFMKELEGFPYKLGGRTPRDPGIDCSGLIEYTMNHFGIKFSGTAASMYNKTVPVRESDALPGDLVFFHTVDYNTVGHVGMYMGNDQFYNSNSKGVGTSKMSSWKKKYQFLGYRRIK